MVEKRRFERIPIQVEFSVRDSATDEPGVLYFLSRNVSAGGAFLASDLLFDRGTWLHVRFQLPGTAPIEATAVVVWVSDELAQEPGMGIEFAEISRASLMAIQRWIDENS